MEKCLSGILLLSFFFVIKSLIFLPADKTGVMRDKRENQFDKRSFRKHIQKPEVLNFRKIFQNIMWKR